MEITNKLNGKDMINIGIFTAVNLVIGIVLACTLGMIPLGFTFLAFIDGIILGIPTMLYFTRIKKFGMILIYQTISGIVMLLTGMGAYNLIFGILLGLIAEVIMKAGQYKNSKIAVLSYGIISITSVSNYIHWLNASAEWVEQTANTYGQIYASTLSGFFQHSWMFPAIIISAFIGGILGGLFGKVVLRKHFIRSGLV